jgi:hypothetical protein
MDTWIELMSEPMSSEILQLELLGRGVIESLGTVICGMLVLSCALWLVVALIHMLREARHPQQSHDACKTAEGYHGSCRERFSQTAKRFSQNQTSAAA